MIWIVESGFEIMSDKTFVITRRLGGDVEETVESAENSFNLLLLGI